MQGQWAAQPQKHDEFKLLQGQQAQQLVGSALLIVDSRNQEENEKICNSPLSCFRIPFPTMQSYGQAQLKYDGELPSITSEEVI